MLYNKQVFIIILVFSIHIASAQVNRYMVFFKNKTQSSYSITAPLAFLSQKAIDRRIKQNIDITENDFPVNEKYISALRKIGVDVFFNTRWQNGVLVQCDQSFIPTILALDFVKSYQLVAPNQKLLAGGRRKSKLSKYDNESSTAVTATQLQMLGIDSMHQQGYHGEGITIAVLDSGFPGVDVSTPFDSILSHQRINLKASYDFISNTSNVFQYDSHGTEVLSTIAAYKQDEFVGAAYKANFQLYITEDASTEYRIEEYNWLFAVERADSAGVDIISTSLGYNTFDDSSMNYKKSEMNGVTTVITQAAQAAADRGILVVCSAGNEGANSWKIISAPADAKDILSVGNVNVQGLRSPSSSVGPSDDERIKPDLVALGTNVSVITPGGSVANSSGTSFAAPLVAGLAAGIWQHYPYLTNKELIEVIRKSASQAKSPDNLLGYGVPNFVSVEKYLDKQLIFDVYPNPFIDTINIRLQNPDEASVYQLELLSQQGHLISNSFINFSRNSRTFKANFENIASGFYFLRITNEKNRHVFKVVKH